MASRPCLIRPEFSSRPSSPFSAALKQGSCGMWKTPFLGPSKTPGWPGRTTILRTGIDVSGGVCEVALFVPRNVCVLDQPSLQSPSTSPVRHGQFSKQVTSSRNRNFMVSPFISSPLVNGMFSNNWSRPLSAAYSSKITSEESDPSSTNSMVGTSEQKDVESVNAERSQRENQHSSPEVRSTVETSAKTDPEPQGGNVKRTPLTAREKLRAARVLSKYTEPRTTRSELGSKVLDAIRETDKGKKRSGLPEAPSNLFDDSKRGLPKQGFTFNFPGGNDILIIAFSFVFISTVMFATTYIVWKVGAIHFNEY